MEEEKQMESIKKDDKITNILIVDGDLTLINNLKDWIKKSETENKNNLRFVYAKNAVECMKKLDEMEINLVVLEIALPMISGYYLIKAIQKEKKDLPIMIYTKLKNPQDLAKMASTNVNNIFLKELMDVQDLVKIIKGKEAGGDIDQIVMELNSQIKALHGTNKKPELKLIQCPQCHLILAPDSHFCNNCGQKILKKVKGLTKSDVEKKEQANETISPIKETEVIQEENINVEVNEESPVITEEIATIKTPEVVTKIPVQKEVPETHIETTVEKSIQTELSTEIPVQKEVPETPKIEETNQ